MTAPSSTRVPPDGPADPAAQYTLGGDYKFGRKGRTQDDVEAVKWYRKAAEQGYAAAEAAMGIMYQAGLGGLAQDDVEAVKWYRKATEQGFAQDRLADMYERGVGGLPKDRRKR